MRLSFICIFDVNLELHLNLGSLPHVNLDTHMYGYPSHSAPCAQLFTALHVLCFFCKVFALFSHCILACPQYCSCCLMHGPSSVSATSFFVRVLLLFLSLRPCIFLSLSLVFCRLFVLCSSPSRFVFLIRTFLCLLLVRALFLCLVIVYIYIRVYKCKWVT